MFWAKIWKIPEFFYLKIFRFWRWNYLYIFEKMCLHIVQLWQSSVDGRTCPKVHFLTLRLVWSYLWQVGLIDDWKLLKEPSYDVAWILNKFKALVDGITRCINSTVELQNIHFNVFYKSLTKHVRAEITKVQYEPQRKKTYLLACAPNEDSNQPAHPRNLIRVFVVRMKKLCILGYPKMSTVKILMGLRKCAGWSGSSLGAHFRRYVSWRFG